MSEVSGRLRNHFERDDGKLGNSKYCDGAWPSVKRALANLIYRDVRSTDVFISMHYSVRFVCEQQP